MWYADAEGLSLKPRLVFDGDCSFCREWIARWQAATGDRVEYVPYQTVADQYPNIPRECFQRAVQLVEPDGRWSSAAEAVLRTLAMAPGRAWPLWLYRHTPGLAWITEAFYRFVAAHRPAMFRVT